MRIKISSIHLRFLAIITLVSLSIPNISHSDNDTNLISQIIKDQYAGSHNKDHGCWVSGITEYNDYCIKPVKAQRVIAHDGERLYVLTEGLPLDADGQVAEMSCHGCAGLVGAFAVKLENGKINKYLAIAKGLTFGSYGRAFGIDEAKLTKIGPSDYYGWVFSSGGTWQGTTISHHNILAPYHQTFVDLSEIPSISEDDQDHVYEINFDTKKDEVKVYPLIVTKFSGDYKTVVTRFAVPFDTKSWRYKLPINK
jgi:hypothetical protein